MYTYPNCHTCTPNLTAVHVHHFLYNKLFRAVDIFQNLCRPFAIRAVDKKNNYCVEQMKKHVEQIFWANKFRADDHDPLSILKKNILCDQILKRFRFWRKIIGSLIFNSLSISRQNIFFVKKTLNCSSYPY
jgi:hypothetical protein